MPTVPVESSSPDPYADVPDVRNVLGTIATRLPAWLDDDKIGEFLSIAHAEILSRLWEVYPATIPTFTGPGADVLRYAEAKLAGAEILEALRVNLPDLGEAPDRLRESVERTLAGGVVGYPPGSVDVDDDGDPDTPGVSSTPGPRVSSFTPLSAFPDPYAAARLDPYADRDLVDYPIRFQ